MKLEPDNEAYQPDEEWMNAPLGTPAKESKQEPSDVVNLAESYVLHARAYMSDENADLLVDSKLLDCITALIEQISADYVRLTLLRAEVEKLKVIDL